MHASFALLPCPTCRDAAADEPAAIDAAEQAARFGRYTVDLATWTVTWSAGVAAIFGRPLPPGGVMSLDDHVGCYLDEDAAACRAALATAIAGPYRGGPYTSQGRVLRPDGTIRHVIAQGTGFADQRGSLASTTGILLDNTDAVEADRIARDHAETLRITLEAIDQGIMMVGPDKHIRVVNEKARRLLDVPDALTKPGIPFAEVLAYQERTGEFTRLAAANHPCLQISSDEASARTYVRERPNGTVLEVRTARLPDGGFVRTYSDVTERHQKEEALRLSEQRLAFALDSGGDGIWSYECDRDRLVLAGRWWSILGYKEHEIEPTFSAWHALTHPDDEAHLRGALGDHLKGRTAAIEVEYRIRTKQGGYVWTLARGKVANRTDDGRAKLIIGTHMDISRRKAAEQAVAHMATHDALTGLANRTLFLERLEQAFSAAARHGSGFAVLACDLDRFKAVNDTYGHAAGDDLLVAVAQRLTSVVRTEDTVARFGGDEFFILLGHADGAPEATATAERAIAAVGQSLTVAGHAISVGMSIGIALGLDQGRDADSLCERADLAMYVAKASGRNCSRVYDSDVDILRPGLSQRGAANLQQKADGAFTAVPMAQ